MKPIESAEEFAARLVAVVRPRDYFAEQEVELAQLIEADRRAVRLALLGEIAVLVAEMQCDGGHEYEVANQRAIEMARSKYSKPQT